MNEYKITYTVVGKSDTYSVNWIERTVVAARRAFLRNRKEMGTVVEVSGIELIRDDACATKQQERDTLAVISRMVAELGPQSYLKTAFEGCFEIAEQNIEYDFGDSLKGRLECAEKEAKKLEADLKKVQADFDRLAKKTELDDRDLRAAISKTKKEASQAITSLRKQVLALDDLEDFHQLLDARIAEYEERVENAAQEIVKYADDPTGDEFKQAVSDNRSYTKKAEYYRELLGRVKAVEIAVCAKSVSGQTSTPQISQEEWETIAGISNACQGEQAGQ